MSGARVAVSVVVPIAGRHDDTATVYAAYRQALDAAGRTFEFIYVLDGAYPVVLAELQRLKAAGEPIRIVTLAKWFGEATALSAGFEVATGEVLLTLPAYQQIDAVEIPKLLGELEHCDLVLARRWPRRDPWLNRVQGRLYNALLGRLCGVRMHDAGCAVRVLRRQVAEEIHLYGELHRFIPVLAYQRGFKIVEVAVTQSSADMKSRVYRPGVYVRRMLDLLAIIFVVKFTKRPLRFFGLIGTSVAAAGVLVTAVLVAERLFADVALADRPALLFATLLIVVGIQFLAIGLLGELLIFTRAKEVRDYHVERVIN